MTLTSHQGKEQKTYFILLPFPSTYSIAPCTFSFFYFSISSLPPFPLSLPFLLRIITVQATDGDATEGPVSVTTVTFDRTCSVWRDSSGTQRRVLRVPREFPQFNKLGLCRGVNIGRLEVANSMTITTLEFLGNVTVSGHAGSFPDSIIPVYILLSDIGSIHTGVGLGLGLRQIDMLYRIVGNF